ncbi:MAG: hypothetical protein IH933_17190 [Euryarchaeota archaeon]|jgi:hypothetical protein|nr:hypothetical protein [Euryarchaeota archaeon]
MSHIQSLFDTNHSSNSSTANVHGKSLGDLVLSLLDSAFAGVFSPVQEEHVR